MSSAPDISGAAEHPAAVRGTSGAHPRALHPDPRRSGVRPVDPAGNAQRPGPTLASSLLEAELLPRTPGSRLVRFGAPAVALLGAGVGMAAGGASALTLALVAPLLLAAGVALVDGSYDRRARWVMLLGLAALVLAEGARLTVGDVSPIHVLLAAGVPVHAAALLHRAQHRASGFARLFAAGGVVLLLAWLATDRGLAAAVVAQDTVAGWTPAVLRVALVPVAGLGLLAFMPSTTTAGAEHWWALALLWLAGFELAGWALAGAPDAAPAAPAVVVAGAALVAIAAPQRLAARCCAAGLPAGCRASPAGSSEVAASDPVRAV